MYFFMTFAVRLKILNNKGLNLNFVVVVENIILAFLVEIGHFWKLNTLANLASWLYEYLKTGKTKS